MSKQDIVLVANSPGELSALVSPVAEELGKDAARRIILVLTPCQYASGKEREYVKTIAGISDVITADDYKNWMLKNQKPNIIFNPKGLVLYLGGDLSHAIFVAKKLRYPAFAYVQDRIGWKSFYKMFFVPDESSRRKLDKNNRLKKKIKIVGNLMADSVAHLNKWSPEENVITFMPGSRAWQIKHMTPLYEGIIRSIKKSMPEAVFQLVSSPFETAAPIAGTKQICFEDIHNSELVVTIPGTNTARLAALGAPMLVLFPLDKPEVIPLEGLPHAIGKIPLVGVKFKHWLADALNKKTKFFALPNIKANEEIVPEIRGEIDPALAAEKIVFMLKNKPGLLETSKHLVRALGGPGAARKITEELNEAL